MEKTQIVTNQSHKELKEHGSYQFPILVSTERLLAYETGSFLWHWHPEIELTYILEGTISYRVNDREYRLKQGDALFGNSRTLHSGRGEPGQDCRYVSVTFHPRLIYGYEGSQLQSEYVEPLTDSEVASVCFNGSQDWHEEAVGLIRTMAETAQSKQTCYQMDMQILLLRFWRLLYLYCRDKIEEKDRVRERSYERIRQILVYIQDHYRERMELEDIAAHIHLCRSECCRLFKRYMNESLFEYILKYRVERSLPLLNRSDTTITEAAWSVGFHDSNYYSRIFRRVMGCTPGQYRKQKEDI